MHGTVAAGVLRTFECLFACALGWLGVSWLSTHTPSYRGGADNGNKI